ncbi:hypothetical protein G3257_11470 [Janthinobacterium lividum]|uniref:hypothetical protein n=1 Tax=Janthinobacterium lividum TaxID=29581 RepID=UPI00159521B1|nr:hypothetical protein [Janthinobacterium lividum]QKY02800.1 hypothetical protein G3257_11470 [Janthinobacterium lividum]
MASAHSHRQASSTSAIVAPSITAPQQGDGDEHPAKVEIEHDAPQIKKPLAHGCGQRLSSGKNTIGNEKARNKAGKKNSTRLEIFLGVQHL